VFGIALTLSVRALTVLSDGILAGNLTVTAVLLLGVIGTSQSQSLSLSVSVFALYLPVSLFRFLMLFFSYHF